MGKVYPHSLKEDIEDMMAFVKEIDTYDNTLVLVVDGNRYIFKVETYTSDYGEELWDVDISYKNRD